MLIKNIKDTNTNTYITMTLSEIMFKGEKAVALTFVQITSDFFRKLSLIQSLKSDLNYVVVGYGTMVKSKINANFYVAEWIKSFVKVLYREDLTELEKDTLLFLRFEALYNELLKQDW